MNLAELIMVCALGGQPGVHPATSATLYRMVEAHSGGRTLLVYDQTGQTEYEAKSREEGARIAHGLLRGGRVVKLGLAGVDARVFLRMRRPLADAFDGCVNVGLASLALNDSFRVHNPRHVDGLHRALAHYWSPTPSSESIYWGAKVLERPAPNLAALARFSPHATQTGPYRARRSLVIRHTRGVGAHAAGRLVSGPRRASVVERTGQERQGAQGGETKPGKSPSPRPLSGVRGRTEEKNQRASSAKNRHARRGREEKHTTQARSLSGWGE